MRRQILMDWVFIMAMEELDIQGMLDTLDMDHMVMLDIMVLIINLLIKL